MTTAQAGFAKGVLIVILTSVTSYLAHEAKLTDVLNPLLATLVAGLASSLESYLKAQSNNTTALFGAVKLK
jgi:hypothetical protein